MKEPFYSFNRYLREKFGERVHRISINAGFNCPNLDGKLSSQGCIYCNNKGFSLYAGTPKPIEEQIESSISYYNKKFGVKKFIAYFQSFSNTYASIDELSRKYNIIREFPQIAGLFISTRPDCVDEHSLDLIASYSKNYLVWVEYGLQTTHNRILKRLNRNHTYEDFLGALSATRQRNINVGVHLILGLPQASYDDMMLDAKNLAGLDIQGIKFHILHVVKDTALETAYQKGGVNLLATDQYIKIFCDFLERIPDTTVVLRLISTALPDYLVAPLWINNKAGIRAEILKEFERRGTRQGCYFERVDPSAV